MNRNFLQNPITQQQEQDILERLYAAEERINFLTEALNMTMQVVNAMKQKKKND